MRGLSKLISNRVHYAWFVAAVTFLVLLTAVGIRATPSVLIVPFEEAFGWSRGAISFAISINIVLYGLMGPFAAVSLANAVNRWVPTPIVSKEELRDLFSVDPPKDLTLRVLDRLHQSVSTWER